VSTISVDNWNATFPKYPVTVEDKGWVYGVWYCGTSWTRVVLHGQYPPGFLKRALALFPSAEGVLHAPCGTLRSADLPDGHITVDMIKDEVRAPDFVTSCDALPFEPGSFDLILSDPPYTKADSKIYGCPPFPMGKFMKEAHRVLRPGGHLGMLHTSYPSFRRKEWKLVGLIAVVTGFVRATRMFSIFEQVEVRT
jgi:SAM-dependent methyltransferase